MKPNSLSGGHLSTVPGSALMVVHPVNGALPDGYDNADSTKDEFLDEVYVSIASIESDIATIESDIDTLQNSITKTIQLGKTASYTFTQDADSLISQVCLRWNSSTPTIKFGTTAGADDIMDAITLSTTNRYFIVDLTEYSQAGRTVYVTISGGKLDITTYFKLNVFN